MFHVKHSDPALESLEARNTPEDTVRRASAAPKRRFALIGLVAAALFLVGCAGIQTPDGWAAPVEVVDRLLIQSRHGQFSLVDRNTGAALWRYPANDAKDRPFYSTPVVNGTTVYLIDYKGRAVRLETQGTEPVVEWQRDLQAEVVATALLRGNNLIIPTDNGHVVTLDSRTGEVRQVVQIADRRIWGSPAASGTSVYVADMDKGETTAFDVNSGDRLWSQALSGASGADLTLDGNLLLVGSFDSALHALDVDANGTERWAFRGDGWFMTRPLVESGIIYAATMRGTVYAIDRNNGGQRWAYTAADGAEFRSAPVMIGNAVVIAARDGRLFSINAASGALNWVQRVVDDGNIHADLFVSGTDIFILTSKHRLVRVDVAANGLFQTVPVAANR